jgi:16S rRNA (uracil1498-N3)-methyltransferase
VAGDSVTLFDGTGWDVIGEIVSVRRSSVEIRAASRHRVGPPVAVDITCATAIPKGSREDTLVSKCAELGITRLVPIEFERSIVKPDVHWANRRSRYRRMAIESAKQSGASTIMEIADPMDVKSFVTGCRAEVKLIGALTAREWLREKAAGMTRPESVAYLVGPEGDITEKELALAEAAGFMPVLIAATTLRVETAAIAFAASIVGLFGGRQGQAAEG